MNNMYVNIMYLYIISRLTCSIEVSSFDFYYTWQTTYHLLKSLGSNNKQIKDGTDADRADAFYVISISQNTHQ